MSQPLAPRPLQGDSPPESASSHRPRKISTACSACKQRKTKVSAFVRLHHRKSDKSRSVRVVILAKRVQRGEVCASTMQLPISVERLPINEMLQSSLTSSSILKNTNSCLEVYLRPSEPVATARRRTLFASFARASICRNWLPMFATSVAQMSRFSRPSKESNSSLTEAQNSHHHLNYKFYQATLLLGKKSRILAVPRPTARQVLPISIPFRIISPWVEKGHEPARLDNLTPL